MTNTNDKRADWLLWLMAKNISKPRKETQSLPDYAAADAVHAAACAAYAAADAADAAAADAARPAHVTIDFETRSPVDIKSVGGDDPAGADAQFIFVTVDGYTHKYPVDTHLEIARAQRELFEDGIPSAPIYIKQEPNAIRTSELIYARVPVAFESLTGKTIVRIEDAKQHSDTVELHMADGAVYTMDHKQECCETVWLEDICGDLDDLLDCPIIKAEEVTNDDEETEDHLSITWTFYKLQTKKGSVTIRWYGESNGYYSEAVDFCRAEGQSGV